jgi:hypothetical protein
MRIVTRGFGSGQQIVTRGYGGFYIPPPPPIGLVPTIEETLLVVPEVSEDTPGDEELAAMVIEPGLASARALAEAAIDALELEPAQETEAAAAPEVAGMVLEPAQETEQDQQVALEGMEIEPETQTSGDSDDDTVESMQIVPDQEEDSD